MWVNPPPPPPFPPQTEDEQQSIIKEVFHMVSRRDDSVCNFLEGPTYVSFYSDYLFVACGQVNK